MVWNFKIDEYRYMCSKIIQVMADGFKVKAEVSVIALLDVATLFNDTRSVTLLRGVVLARKLQEW